MKHRSSLDEMPNKVNRKAKSPKKQKDTSGKRAYGDSELVSGEMKSKKKRK